MVLLHVIHESGDPHPPALVLSYHPYPFLLEVIIDVLNCFVIVGSAFLNCLNLFRSRRWNINALAQAIRMVGPPYFHIVVDVVGERNRSAPERVVRLCFRE